MSALILIVEDNAVTRKMMRLTLLAEGYSVVEAVDGESALSLVAERSPELVLLDCKLPGIDGFEVGRRLRVLAPSVPVVAVTGWAQADEERVRAAGFMDVLVKPVEASRLLQVVERHVGRAPSARPSTGKLVLLADDDPRQRKLAHLALSSAGFEVVTAEDGEVALRLAMARTPDVIVSDVLMPKLDGFGLCVAVRAVPALALVPVVLMSAHYVEDEDRVLATRFGANCYVSRAGGFDAVVAAAVDAMTSPAPMLVGLPAAELQGEHLRRMARQLERQASLGVGLARRVSVQASALSLLHGLADSLAGQLDPESRLQDTLAQCLDAAGLSIGAILLHEEGADLALNAQLGTSSALEWETHADVFARALAQSGMTLPSPEAGTTGDALLGVIGAASALIVPIVARDKVLGALLLASSGSDLAGADGNSAVRAARSVSLQLGQALALSRTFSKLASAEQRYRALVENARDAIGVLTVDGFILEVNRGWEDIFGVARADVLGRHVGDFAPAADRTQRRSDYTAEVAEGGGSVRPVAFERADGAVVYIELSQTVVDVGGERHVLCIGRDVTERLRLEEQLRQSQKMDAIGRLAGGIAHDFNNLLSVILSYSELLLADLGASDPMRADVDEILQAGTRAAALTRQLLTFSRQEVVEPRVLDLNEVLTGIDKMLQRILGADIDLASRPAKSLGRIRVDPGGIEQIIMNLVVNARDAMPTGGKLTMETGNVELDESYARMHQGMKAGPHVMLAVTDTGLGMDAATRARIFEPFYTTKGVSKGTGLGLSTVFGIVQQAGGSIWVYSEVASGTTFKIYFPRVDAPLGATEHSPRNSLSHGSETVLLVEDDEQVRNVARGILERSGYQVLDANGAGEALLHSEEYDGVIHLLLTDVVMPQVSGSELARRLALVRPAMRVLFMSGYTDDSVVRHGVLESNLAFIQKPFTPTALVARIREVLQA